MFGKMTKNKWYDNMDESIKLLTPKYDIFADGGRLKDYVYNTYQNICLIQSKD